MKRFGLICLVGLVLVGGLVSAAQAGWLFGPPSPARVARWYGVDPVTYVPVTTVAPVTTWVYTPTYVVPRYTYVPPRRVTTVIYPEIVPIPAPRVQEVPRYRWELVPYDGASPAAK